MTTEARRLVEHVRDVLVDFHAIVDDPPDVWEGMEDDRTYDELPLAALDDALFALERHASSTPSADLWKGLVFQSAHYRREGRDGLYRDFSDPCPAHEDWCAALFDLFTVSEVKLSKATVSHLPNPERRSTRWIERLDDDPAPLSAPELASALAAQVAALGDAPWASGESGVAGQCALGRIEAALDDSLAGARRSARLPMRHAARAIRLVARGRVLSYTAIAWSELRRASAILSSAAR